MIGYKRSMRGAAFALVAALGATGYEARAGADDGFLYGRITMKGGATYEGRLRWGTEEAFWGDFFNGTKKSLPHADKVEDPPREREKIKIFGWTVGVRWSDAHVSRAFKARFGDIASIEVRGGERATLRMKSGSEIEIDGGSNDLGGKIRVWDAGIGEIDVEWDRIDTIAFMPVKGNLGVQDHRLHGTVHTKAGEFRGFIQWDQDECLSSDKLDGETEDAEMAIEMGNLVAIERRGSSGSRVTLTDGRTFVLEDSNDVDSDNRGIFVEDERYGRVLVPWDEFDRVEFSKPPNSGPGYGDYKAARQLLGTVTTRDGAKHKGDLVYDLDESETWEYLDGNRRDIEYSIPFEKIRSIVPEDEETVRVTLRGGETIELEGSADTGEGNAGVLVLQGEKKPVHVKWSEVAGVELE